MSSIPVHPIKEEKEHDSFSIECTFRLRVLDVATGDFLANAYAEKPAADLKVLERRGVHPFRVLNARSVDFNGGELGDFKFDVRTLKTFVEDAAASKPDAKALVETWKCVSEFFHPALNGEVLVNKSGDTRFQRILTGEPRFVGVKDASATYAERALITGFDGVLAVPISFKAWLAGTKITVKFRDYKIMKADGEFSPEKLGEQETAAGLPPSKNGFKALKVSLQGDPIGNDWRAKPGTKEQKFDDEITFEMPRVSREEIDFTVWAVRRVKRLSDLVPAGRIAPGSGRNFRAGIMVHYNSGYYCTELRPDAKHKVNCRDAFTDRENRYMMDPNMAMAILRKINDAYEAPKPGKVGRLGYNYHIAPDGTMLPAVDETLVIWHAGESREPDAVEAVENVDSGPRTVSQKISKPKNNLNDSYIGIDLLGNHQPGFHYTVHQHWYLDRLIENIRGRNPGILWHHILGHDEARAAYRDFKGITGDAVPKPKADPGAALEGGMTKLRGRHGAPFPVAKAGGG